MYNTWDDDEAEYVLVELLVSEEDAEYDFNFFKIGEQKKTTEKMRHMEEIKNRTVSDGGDRSEAK